MNYKNISRKLLLIGALLLFLLLYSLWVQHRQEQKQAAEQEVFWELDDSGDTTIKWVDFQVPCEALKKAYRYDVGTYEKEPHIDWIDLLALTAARSGGNFTQKALQDMDKMAAQFVEGESTLEELTKELKYFSYYREAYDAVLHSFG